MTTNKLAQAALGNWAIVAAIGLGKLMSTLFLGPLRDIEIEVGATDCNRGMSDQSHVYFRVPAHSINSTKPIKERETIIGLLSKM